MTTTEQKQKQEMVLPSFFYAIASSESRQLISLDELQRIITLDAMTQARTEDYRKNMRISSELAHQTKVMMPGITTSVLMDGRGKELRNVVKTTQMIAVDIDKIPAEKMKEVVQKADADPHTMMRFITVSQRGLRIISRYLPIDDDEVTALELFDVIIRKAMSYYSKLLGVPADEQCVDITRTRTRPYRLLPLGRRAFRPGHPRPEGALHQEGQRGEICQTCQQAQAKQPEDGGTGQGGSLDGRGSAAHTEPTRHVGLQV